MRWFPLAGLAAGCLLAVAACGGKVPTTESLPAGPAPPQTATVDWSERTAPAGAALMFAVRAFRVTAKGWSADVGIDNDTDVTWRLDGSSAEGIVAGSYFGAMVFPTGTLGDAEEASRQRSLPPVRRAETVTPAFPDELPPGGSWRGTIAADGRLPAGLWVRLSFGPLWTTETPPAGLQSRLVWFTDHAVRLRGAPVAVAPAR